MKLATIFLSTILIAFPAYSQYQYGSDSPANDIAPGSNTVSRFGETFKKNKKFGYTHYKNHESYAGWLQPQNNTSCCNGINDEGKGDCDIVHTYLDVNEDEYYIVYNGKPLKLAKEKRLKERDGSFKKTHDGNSHACVTEYSLGNPIAICWVLGDSFQ